MKNKGFTLIELLAVILILGIIALIAIPTVSSVVEESRRGAFQSTVRNVIKAVEEGCISSKLSEIDYPNFIQIKYGEADYKIELKGSLPDEAFIYIEPVSCSVAMKAHDGKFMIVKEYDSDDAEVVDYLEDNYKLTSTYEVVNYIESTGTQFIDTGIKNTSNLRAILDYSAKSTTVQFFYGARIAASQKSFSFLTQATGDYRVDFSSGQQHFSNIDYDTRYILDQNKRHYTLKDMSGNVLTDYTYGIAHLDFETDLNIFLFAINQNGAAYKNALMTLYSFKLYDNDVLVRDYVPIKLVNGKGALFDKVNNKIYENKGTGDFLVG